MNETKLKETKPKKMVSRNVAVALGIICIILVALIAYFTVTGISAENSYNNLQNQNKQLQTWLDGNETLLNQTQTWLGGNGTLLNETQSWLEGNITFYTSQMTNLQNQVYNLTSIVNLSNSTVWVDDQTISQPASSYTLWTFSAIYAGYVSVLVNTSTVAGTHVRVVYSSYGVNFNQDIVVNASNTAENTAVFPLLPSSSIQVEVGNVNVSVGATETVTITYYY